MKEAKKMITIMCKDHKGLMAEISELLSNNNININNIEAQSYNDNAILHLEINNQEIDKSLSLLTKAGYHAMSDEVILVCLEDKPGSLAKVARKLSDNNVEIKGITSMWRNHGIVMVVLNTNNNVEAKKILADVLV
ncbi:MAG: hypothetical protein RLZZ210_100 [Pseudomonadota bacterium]|jgi:hypothetical protein